MTTEGQSTLSPGAARRRGASRSITTGIGEAPGRDSYYGQPVINHPVWTWEIPVYFFTGGLAGAAAPLAFVAGVRGEDRLAKRMSVAAVVFGGMMSPALLIADLGVPRRFLNMLRMFKVTSPMSVGAWILASFGPAAAGGTAWRLKLLPRSLGLPAEASSAVLGPLLGTYTAALIANTSVPVWHEARHELPFVFAGSCLTSAGALGAIVVPDEESGAARRMALAGSVIELATTQYMERKLGPLARPYKEGTSGRLAKATKALTLAGGVGMAIAGRRRHRLAAAAGAALLAGAFAERWAIFKAGMASADDPAATVEPQRRRRRAG
ncbi:MAG TPA: NrfD/PsrC family molybdoenzyme membrane anchor subunit [Capillimicrobium sp.]|nr:NrfD/PsrC family molybdoenzyme membrane anchor subunit [Capillimicrobium sp.]